jgi:tetratricopeptide (TPR) repeat protein
VLTLLLLLPSVARAADGEPPMNADAKAHYDRGLALYQDKDYAAASREFDAGYAIDPRREFLFADAQAKRLAGDCRGAVPLYQRFLETSPAAVQVNATQIALARCAQQLAAARAEPQAALPPPPPQPPPAPPPPPPRPWTRDRWGGGLLLAGAAALATGAGLVVAAHETSTAGPLLADYQRGYSRAEARLTAGLIAIAGGAALTGAAIYRYASLRRQQRLQVNVVIAPGALWLAGRF